MPLNIAMVSTHPDSEGGVSSYTENLIRSLREHGLNVHLITNKVKDNSIDECEDIFPCWDFGFRYPFQIFKTLYKCKPDIIHIQHEYFLYGGALSALLFPVLIFLAKLSGCQVIVTLHGVIPLSELSKKFLTLNDIKGPASVHKIGLIFLTKIILLVSDSVIVHGNFFAETLIEEYGCPEKKIHVIPHGIKKIDPKVSQDVAKNSLGLKRRTMIFFFGYIAKYKGVEMLIDGFQLLTEKYPDWVLIIGGGAHPRFKNNYSYNRYVSKLRGMAYSTNKQIIFTGFIKEEDLAKYFSAADLLVFPYTVIMSYSGPFAIASSYGKCVISSNIPPFTEYLPKEALFERSAEDLARKIDQVLNHPSLRDDISKHVMMMKYRNSWDKVGRQTEMVYRLILTKGEENWSSDGHA